jgi:hypothetical protein
VEEWANDHETWGKTTAQPWGLASGKGAAVAHLGVGGKTVERGKLQLGTPFIGEGEREEVTVVPHVGDKMLATCWTSWTMVRTGLVYPGSLTGGPRSGFQTWHEPEQYGPHNSSVRPANNCFSIFPNSTKYVNYENHPDVCNTKIYIY